jgi:hypothetical protein
MKSNEKLYEEIYKKYDGKYGDLVQAHIELMQNGNKAFKEALKRNECPFCKKEMKYYDGALGYEAMKCSCGLTVDHNGIHLE